MTSDYANRPEHLIPKPNLTASERRGEDNPHAEFFDRDDELFAKLRTGFTDAVPEIRGTDEAKAKYPAAYEVYRKAGGKL
jgi:hypothetical protein